MKGESTEGGSIDTHRDLVAGGSPFSQYQKQNDLLLTHWTEDPLFKEPLIEIGNRRRVDKRGTLRKTNVTHTSDF